MTDEMKYDEWCDLHSFNPESDDNYHLYLIWLQRERTKQ